jgi:hypothetical protein
MRKLTVVLGVMMVLFVGVASAQWQRNENGQDQGQAQAQGQGQAQGQLQGQLQGQITDVGVRNRVSSKTSTAQEQIANGEVSVGGDSDKSRTYVASYPSLSGGEGVSQANAYSVFGGLGLSNTEAYKKYITQMQAIEASTILTAEDKKALTEVLVKKLMETNKKQRMLGILWETSGRNLLNLFGILSWDSFWNENQEPFSKKPKQ